MYPLNNTLLVRLNTFQDNKLMILSFKVTSLLDKWYGESQKRTAAIFSLARKLQPSIIFIDEIDSFMRTRQNDDHECTRMVMKLIKIRNYTSF